LTPRHGEAINRRAAAAIGRHVPAVALENQRGFVAVPGQHMPVDLVEAAVGAPAGKPAPVRRIVAIESASPGGKISRQLGGNGCTADGVPARPAVIVAARNPCTMGSDIADEPVDRTIRDIAVERARIGQARIAHRLPIGAGAHRIDGCRNVWRTARCLLLFQVNPSLNSLIFVLYERPAIYDL
jgi:hypothetical protein